MAASYDLYEENMEAGENLYGDLDQTHSNPTASSQPPQDPRLAYLQQQKPQDLPYDPRLQYQQEQQGHQEMPAQIYPTSLNYNEMILPPSEPNSSAVVRTGDGEIRPDTSDPAMTKAILIGELPWWTTDSELRSIIELSGVTADFIPTEMTFCEHKVNGKSRGIAYMEFSTPAAAAMVKAYLEQAEIHGKKPTINYVPSTQIANPFRTLEQQTSQSTSQSGQQNSQQQRSNSPNQYQQGQQRHGMGMHQQQRMPYGRPPMGMNMNMNMNMNMGGMNMGMPGMMAMPQQTYPQQGMGRGYPQQRY